MITKFLITVLIAMVPVIELRGAIPYAVSAGLPVGTALIAAIIGNMIPVPFIILFIRKIFAWLRVRSAKLEKFVSWCEKKAEKSSKTVYKYELLGLMLFVAIPLPGTGAWTGALIAALLNLRLKNTLPFVFMGVVIAAIVVCSVSYGVKVLFA